MWQERGEFLFPPPCKDSVGWRPLQARKRNLTRTWPCTLISYFQNCERIHLYCLSHPVYGILLWQPELMSTMTNWDLSHKCRIDFILKKSVNALYHSNRTKEENHMSISIGEERVLDKINTLSWWKHLTPRNRKKLPSPDNIYEPPIASFTLNVEKLQRLHAFPRERCSLYPLIFSIVLKILTRTILGKKMR